MSQSWMIVTMAQASYGTSWTELDRVGLPSSQGTVFTDKLTSNSELCQSGTMLSAEELKDNMNQPFGTP